MCALPLFFPLRCRRGVRAAAFSVEPALAASRLFPTGLALLGSVALSGSLYATDANSDRLVTAQALRAPSSRSAGAPLFTPLSAVATGIVTENNYAPPPADGSGPHDPRMWGDRYREFEVGAVGTGVAIGDFDADGRPDVFVVSKTESCRLFRNLGDWRFEDVTERSGVVDRGPAAAIWKQGAAFADVNNDGLLDLYVCRFGAPNLLYVNQGNGTFREEAGPRGLAVNDASVQAAFCDYDRDGWLDVYVQTNLLNGIEHPKGQKDYLFRNNRDGTFTDVTERAGIRGETQGHSCVWWDFNQDGWPDLYVANDFAAKDSLYRNNGDGTFADVIDRVVPHLPYSSMGSDLGDVNNDGLIDFFVADMAATTHQKDQRGMASLRAQVDELARKTRAAPQLARNALYLATGTEQVLEAACLAGLEATDWTWSVRFEDLDNDGRIDLFVTNGMHREVHNVDVLQRLMTAESLAERLRIEKSSPVLTEQNLAFRNLGELQFADVSADWGLNDVGVSFGAAFGDLDGDGDLDLVYTNFRKGATVLRNDSDQGHRVLFALRGTRSNRFGVGATVRVETASGLQVRQLVLSRGVVSTSEPTLHFGLGQDSELKRVTIAWPSGITQVLESLPADHLYTVQEPDEAPAASPLSPPPFQADTDRGLARATLFTPVPDLALASPLPTFAPGQLDVDLDGDGRPERIVAKPWETVKVYHRAGDAEEDWSERYGFAAAGAGAWSALQAADFNGDGRPDIVAGNAGLNTPYRADPVHPLLLFTGDFSGDGAEASIEAYFEGDRVYPRATRKELAKTLPGLLKRFPKNDLYARATLEEIVGREKLASAQKSAITELRSGVFLSTADGRYVFHALPRAAQIGPVRTLGIADFDGDGKLDLAIAGNDYAPVVGGVRNDGGVGLILLGNGDGQFTVLSPAESGFVVTGNVTALLTAEINGDHAPDLVAHRPDGTSQVFQNRGKAP